MKYLLIIVFTFIYIANPNIGYSQNSPLYTHFIYMFGHNGLIHLFVNLISFFSLFNFLSKVISPAILFIYVYLSAVIASFFSSASLPTVGASGMICALIAIYALLPLFGKKLIIQNRRKFFRWLMYTLAALIISSCFPAINAANHFFALLSGIFFTIIDNYINA